MIHVTLSNSLIAMVLQDFPECLVMVMLVFSILNLRFQPGTVLAIAGLQACTNLLENLPVIWWAHSIIFLLTLSIYTRIFTRALLSRILLAAVITFAVLILAEGAYALPLIRAAGVTPAESFANPFLRSAFALPYELFLLLLALGKNYYNRRRGLLAGA